MLLNQGQLIIDIQLKFSIKNTKIDLVKKLIEKMIFSKTDLFTGVDIDLDDSGRVIFI